MVSRVLTAMVLVAVALGSSTEARAGARYFGYYGSHYINTAPGCAETSFMNHTNVAMIWAGTSEGFPEKLHLAAACNQRSILAVANIFFTDNLSGNGGVLLGDPEVLAQGLRNQFTAGDLALIVAFHSYDEPFWNLGLATKAQRKIDLDAVHLALKHKFGDVPIYVNFAFPELLAGHGNEMPGIPALTDWVSFDCYMDAGHLNGATWVAGSFEMCGPTSIPAYIADLKRRMNNSQKLVLVPPAFVHRPQAALANDCTNRYPAEDQVPLLADFVDKYLNLARSEPRVVAVMPYEWRSRCYDSGNPAIPGSWHEAVGDAPSPAMQAVGNKFRVYGQEVKNGPVIIDSPLAVSQTLVTVRGWALDRRAASGIGVDAIHVYAWPIGGGSPTFVGATTPGVTSNDAATIHGPAYSTAGYTLTGTVPPGTYTLAVYAHNTFDGLWNQSVQPLQIKTSSPIMSVDTPTQNQTVASWFAVSGWAIDSAETSTTGVDAVDVWVGPAGGVPTVYLGNAALNGDRPDVAAAANGSQFRFSGFNTIVSLSPGTYDLFIYARSTVTGTFNNAVVRRVTVP
jgi:hypothetical protein